MKPLLRRLLRPVIRWLVRGSSYQTWLWRQTEGVFIVCEDCFGNTYAIRFHNWKSWETFATAARALLADHAEQIPITKDDSLLDLTI